MARRKKTGPAEDMMDLVAMMPWWAGVVLALVFYFVLHAVASREVVVNVKPGQIHSVVLPTIIKTLASIGQYILPLICLIGAVVSVVRRSKRTGLIKDVATSKAWQPLEGITWKEFEILVGEAFRLQGYQVTENHAGGADGGIDLVLRKGNEKFFVQCKQWKAFTVGVTIVRELYGVMAAERAVGGFVVTSGKFTKDAEEFAKGRNVELIDGPKLMTMIRAAQAARKSSATAPRPAAPAPAKPILAPSPARVTPSCPVCSKSMVQRTAKKGANAGQSFWGCTGYPSCRGTRPAG
jgi:restriction system protein